MTTESDDREPTPEDRLWWAMQDAPDEADEWYEHLMDAGIFGFDPPSDHDPAGEARGSIVDNRDGDLDR